MMTRKTKIFILCVVILLGAALLKYGASVRSTSTSARQHEEAVKLAQLEADLIKAVAEGNGQADNSGTMSGRYTGSTPKPRPT